MVETVNIKWKNIFYMMCYAIDELKNFEYEDIDTEDVEGVNDLLAKLLIASVEQLINYGLFRNYEDTGIITSKPFGRIDIAKSYNLGTIPKGELYCDVTLMDINNKYNQIIKAALQIMVECNFKSKDKIRKELVNNLRYLHSEFNQVDDIEVDSNSFDNIDIDNASQIYKSSLIVCKLIIESWLLTDKKGNHKQLNLSNKNRLKYIFEKFVRNYYIWEYKEAKTNRPTYYISKTSKRILDMVLENDANALIIDTKFYDTSEDNTSNEDTIYVYGKLYLENNVGTNRKVTALLLYADSVTIKVAGPLIIKEELDKNKEIPVYIEKLDINQDFEDIKQNLKGLADKYLNIKHQ